jgi:hypothetical protein
MSACSAAEEKLSTNPTPLRLLKIIEHNLYLFTKLFAWLFVHTEQEHLKIAGFEPLS